MTTGTPPKTDTLTDIAGTLREHDRWLVASHLNPDGDAIGSSRAMELIGEALGVDVRVYIPGAVVPDEYAFIRPQALSDQLPADLEDRLLVAVDCGNEGRLKSDDVLTRAVRTVNIDHHADNTRYGDLNHVVGEAPCATLLVWRLAQELGVPVEGELATALYIGLVTDTGRFQYSNTTTEAFAMASALVEAGVDVHDIFRRVYEQSGFHRVKLLGRGLEKAVSRMDGRIVATHLTRADFDAADADDDDAEGIVEVLRGVEGAYVAVFVRDLEAGASPSRKGSLRTTRDDVDVSIIARSWSGGGHRQAAGFNTDDDLDTIVTRVEQMLTEQLEA